MQILWIIQDFSQLTAIKRKETFKFIFNRSRNTQKPRLIKVESRQYEVTMHYSKVTKEDYEEETFKTVCKIHKNLPLGHILVFLTGRQEIQVMVERLRIELDDKKQDNQQSKMNVDEEDEKSENSDKEEGEGENNNFSENEDQRIPVQILPLYSMLSPEEQSKVFEAPKEGHRLIVVSTNIAETSITIPNIKYVVDCGREKQKVYDSQLRMSKFMISWVSKASADQRAGRAGRTGPGHCYRLFSSALFGKMTQYATPEILRVPIDQTILQLKSLGVNDLVKFPFITSPNLEQVKSTLRELCILGALEVKSNKNVEDEFKQDLIPIEDEKLISEEHDQILNCNFDADKTRITDLGILLSTIPLSPKYAKMLIFGQKAKIIELAILTVASLTVQELFVKPKMTNLDPNDIKEVDIEFDQDEALVTQIDIDYKMNKIQKSKQQVKDKIKQKKREYIKEKFKMKEKWFSDRGDIHTNVLVLGTYMSVSL